jgi:hypothetical protein
VVMHTHSIYAYNDTYDVFRPLVWARQEQNDSTEP